MFEIDKNNCLIKLININEFIIKYENNIDTILKYQYEIKESLLLIKCYNFHFINSFKTGIDIDYISFININDLEKGNPYYRAITFLKNVIENLKENSILFEILLNFDSEVISNVIKENKEINSIDYTDIYGNKRTIDYKKNPTEYGINLLNIKEIKHHLLQLIPKFIIIINTDLRFRADYLNKGNIMTINEKILFKKNQII